jgi:hypothetical protein
LNQDPNKTLTYNQIVGKLEILLNCSDLSKLKHTIQNYIVDREQVAIFSSAKTADRGDQKVYIIAFILLKTNIYI